MNIVLDLIACIPAAICVAALLSPLLLFWIIIDDTLNGAARFNEATRVVDRQEGGE